MFFSSFKLRQHETNLRGSQKIIVDLLVELNFISLFLNLLIERKKSVMSVMRDFRNSGTWLICGEAHKTLCLPDKNSSITSTIVNRCVLEFFFLLACFIYSINHAFMSSCKFAVSIVCFHHNLNPECLLRRCLSISHFIQLATRQVSAFANDSFLNFLLHLQMDFPYLLCSSFFSHVLARYHVHLHVELD